MFVACRRDIVPDGKFADVTILKIRDVLIPLVRHQPTRVGPR